MKNIFTIAILFTALLFAGCIQTEQPITGEQQGSLTTPGQPDASTGQTAFSLTSSAFANNGIIPDKYSCNGAGTNPPLQFNGVPQGTRSLALVMDDLDTIPIMGVIFTHWVIFNIQPSATEIPDGSPIGVVGVNGPGQNRYEGVCPPPGETHTYSFKLYALDSELNLQESATKEQLETAMQGHILAQTELKGKYTQAG